MPKSTPYAYLLVTMMLFGTAFTGSKVVVGQLPHQVAAVLRFGGGALTGSRALGELAYLLAAGCWAAYSIVSKRVLGGMDPLRATTYATGVGALALGLLAIPSLPSTNWSGVGGSTWASLVFLAIGPTAIAYLFYFRGLRAVSPVTATIMMFTVPVFGTISSVVFLGESFTGLQVAGALITIGGALLAVVQRPARTAVLVDSSST
ncbi:DMT family transporter [Kribbella sp. NPDC051770]|uniref:DMT family transporter n=1 Tax=Kribbella sp. NPDC051770 TaxID=3155413 RepID=UPI003418432E